MALLYKVVRKFASWIAAQHLGGLNPDRRHANLAAGAITIEGTLTDATLATFEKLMAVLGRDSQRKADERAARSMREVQGDLSLAAGVGWDRFESAVVRAEAIAPPETIDPMADLIARHRSVKTFGPRLLGAFSFESSPVVRDLMDALALIRAT